jgi:hypothetical protein
MLLVLRDRSCRVLKPRWVNSTSIAIALSSASEAPAGRQTTGRFVLNRALQISRTSRSVNLRWSMEVPPPATHSDECAALREPTGRAT